jgi:hypothetical protein
MQKPGAGVGGNRVELREYTLSTTGSESVWPIVSGSYENSWEKRRAKWWLRTVVRGGIYLRCGAIRVLWGEEGCVSARQQWIPTAAAGGVLVDAMYRRRLFEGDGQSGLRGCTCVVRKKGSSRRA